jgi:F0F1-type ATP synthase delta subunit
MSKTYISLKEAKHQFSILLDSISESDKADFISSIYKEQICNETINDYLDGKY